MQTLQSPWWAYAVVTGLLMCCLSCSDPEEKSITITSVSPEAGGIGTRVTIKGSGFGHDISAVQVFFNEKPAVVSEVSDTLINTTVPQAATSGDLLVNIGTSAQTWSGTFTVLNGRWERVADMPGAGRGVMAAFAINGKGYVTGGTDNGSGFSELYEYDPATNEWTEKSPFPGATRYAASVFTIGNKAYVGMGKLTHSSDSLDGVSFYEYDPATDTWTQKANFPGGMFSWGLGFSINGKGYAGLGTHFQDVADFYSYDPDTDTWTKLNDTNFIASAGVGFVVDGIYYGGCGEHMGQQWWKYNPTADQWTRLQDVPFTNFIYQAGFSIGDKGYVSKGVTNVWEYDPATDSWTQKTSEPDSQITAFSSSFTIGNKAYVGGGMGGFFTTKFFEFDPQ